MPQWAQNIAPGTRGAPQSEQNPADASDTGAGVGVDSGSGIGALAPPKNPPTSNPPAPEDIAFSLRIGFKDPETSLGEQMSECDQG